MKLNLTISIVIYLAMSYNNSIAQVTKLDNIRPAFPAFTGWDGTGFNPGDLQIRNDFALQPIHFFAGGFQSMSILGTNGFVGIGSNTPIFQLEVSDDINLLPGAFPNSGFRWQDTVIINTDNVMSNIYYGRGAGKFVTGFSSSNTYIGVESGKNNQSMGGGNTFVGISAGMSGRNDECVFVGSGSGENTIGNNNTFVGVSSGFGSSGFRNSYFGQGAGFNSVGNDNIFIGMDCGFNNTADQNTFIGNYSGNANTTVTKMLFLGQIQVI